MQLLETIPTGPSRFEICTSSLVLYFILGAFCLLMEVDGIESDLRQRVNEALRTAPLQWYAVHVDGQAVHVSGVINSDQDARPAQSRVTRLPGTDLAGWSIESVSDGGLCQGRLDVFAAKAGIAFRPGTAELEPGSEPGIDRMAAVIRHCAPRVEVGAHTAGHGDDGLNLQLSERRAAVLTRALVRSGVLEDQLLTRGYGETQPLQSGTSTAADLVNERVTFRVRGKPV